MIDAGTATENQMQEIAGACSGFLPLDMIFLVSLAHIKRVPLTSSLLSQVGTFAVIGKAVVVTITM